MQQVIRQRSILEWQFSCCRWVLTSCLAVHRPHCFYVLLKCKSQSVLHQNGTWASVPQQRMQRRTLNEILPLSQIIYVIVIGKNNLKCIFFMSYWQRINFFSWIEQWKVNIYQTDYHSLSHWIYFDYFDNFINNLQYSFAL